ncbi:MAG: hypothetical protein U5J98_08680 [Halobacteriales archaeon]|nr:hypothetical protein [Halobacteriales archaeon]
MQRRRYLALAGGALATLAGCSSAPGTDESPGTAVQVTTSTADGIEFHVAQVSIPADASGPNAYYRLENTADSDATIRIETVLGIPEGGTYHAFAVVTVPAGDEVTVSYRIVPFDALTDEEAAKVRRGDVELTVLVNGEERREL